MLEKKNEKPECKRRARKLIQKGEDEEVVGKKKKMSKGKVKKTRDILPLSKKPTTPGIPRRSPIQVLTGPYAA